MRIHLLVVGRLRGGPEAALTEDYILRAGQTGAGLGPIRVSVQEIEPRGGRGPEREGAAVLEALASGAVCVLLDEKGAAWTSRELARRIAAWRDQSVRDLVFVIGGADGASPALKDRAQILLALGPQTWPHKLVRVMAAEQIYRALSILAGSPYHRD